VVLLSTAAIKEPEHKHSSGTGEGQGGTAFRRLQAELSGKQLQSPRAGLPTNRCL